MKTITAQEFDKKFDDGEDISEYLDLSKATKLKDMKELKTETKKVGITRQSIIKIWIADRLKEEAQNLQVS
jgi:biotin operon repressor